MANKEAYEDYLELLKERAQYDVNIEDEDVMEYKNIILSKERTPKKIVKFQKFYTIDDLINRQLSNNDTEDVVIRLCEYDALKELQFVLNNTDELTISSVSINFADYACSALEISHQQFNNIKFVDYWIACDTMREQLSADEVFKELIDELGVEKSFLTQYANNCGFENELEDALNTKNTSVKSTTPIDFTDVVYSFKF